MELKDTSPSVHHLFLCGWHLASEIPLPELREWEQPEAPVDVSIRLGEVPPFPGMEAETRRFTVQSPDHCRIVIPGVATFGVREGRELLVDPVLPADSVELRNYLFGTGLGLLCHQRGVFPFHGSCLQLGDQAVIFSGNSGAGKSTLAAALVQRGHKMIADDVCALTYTEGTWVVWPAFPRVKLKSTAHHVVFGADPLPETLSLQGKHHFRFDPVRSFADDPVPVGTIYFLEKAGEGESEWIEDVGGLNRIALLQSQIFRRGMGKRLGRSAMLFQTSAQIAGAVSICRLHRRFDLDQMNHTLRMLEQRHGMTAPMMD